MTSLKLTKVRIDRDRAPIIHTVSLTAQSGAVTVLLGANGAGKTTLLEGVSGILPTSSGSVTVGDTEISALTRRARSKLGLAHVEQGRAIFPSLTTEQNLLVACRDGDRIGEVLGTFPELQPRLGVQAGLLSGGEQQMLVLARALVSDPSVILVDEMSLGLAPVIVRRLMPEIRRIADAGTTVLLVEQFASLALEIADAAYVLVAGRLTYEGSPRTLVEDAETLHTAYLGSSEPQRVAT